jgi:hypothetical protein
MSAWGHRFVSLTEEEKGYYSCNSCRGHWELRPRAIIAVLYDYTTGKQGRTSTAKRRLCRKHADSFAKRYGLTVPEELGA